MQRCAIPQHSASERTVPETLHRNMLNRITITTCGVIHGTNNRCSMMCNRTGRSFRDMMVYCSWTIDMETCGDGTTGMRMLLPQILAQATIHTINGTSLRPMSPNTRFAVHFVLPTPSSPTHTLDEHRTGQSGRRRLPHPDVTNKSHAYRLGKHECTQKRGMQGHVP